jgi:hypothetical protein
VPFSDATLSTLYPSHQAYVSAVRQVTERNVKSGYIVAADARNIVEKASASIVGKRLPCGPLCQNVGGGMDSISKLRDQTAYLNLGGGRGERLVDELDKALEHVARAEAWGAVPARKRNTSWRSSRSRGTSSMCMGTSARGPCRSGPRIP